MFSIWTPSDDPNAWKNSKENTPFGILEWKVEEHKTSVKFLYLTISINKNRKIETRTYQKAINLYLYLLVWLHGCSSTKYRFPRLPSYFLTRWWQRRVNGGRCLSQPLTLTFFVAQRQSAGVPGNLRLLTPLVGEYNFFRRKQQQTNRHNKEIWIWDFVTYTPPQPYQSTTSYYMQQRKIWESF